MMEDNEKIDQSLVAESVSDKIKYEFRDFFLVKPLDPVKVKKEFTKPKTDKAPTKDKNGIEAVDFDDVETEIKEVNSDFRKGIVLKVPTFLKNNSEANESIKVGDVIIFSEMAGKPFDLLKDSKLVRYYDVIAIER